MIQPTNEIVAFVRSGGMQQRIEELLRERAPEFTMSIISIANSNKKIAECTPETVINAALKAAALKLPFDQNLGFAYIVPYKNKGVMEAQFQIGYKGYIQLAQRSSQYRTIATAIVYEGQLMDEDPLRGNTYLWKNKKSDKISGYVSLFALLNGFEKSLYMPFEQVRAHAERYSEAYKYDLKNKFTNSPWSTDFDGMAQKTTIRLLVPKYGPMSVEMIDAVKSDQAILRNDTIEYVDNDDMPEVKASEEKKAAIIAAHTQIDKPKDRNEITINASKK